MRERARGPPAAAPDAAALGHFYIMVESEDSGSEALWARSRPPQRAGGDWGAWQQPAWGRERVGGPPAGAASGSRSPVQTRDTLLSPPGTLRALGLRDAAASYSATRSGQCVRCSSASHESAAEARPCSHSKRSGSGRIVDAPLSQRTSAAVSNSGRAGRLGTALLKSMKGRLEFTTLRHYIDLQIIKDILFKLKLCQQSIIVNS